MTSRTSTTKWLSARFREDGFVGLINISRTKKAKRFIRSAGVDRTERLSSAATKRHLRGLRSRRRPLADLKVEKAAVDGERRTIEADFGPVRYPATLLGAADQDVMRWFILAVALLLDPAAVLLLLAAARTRS